MSGSKVSIEMHVVPVLDTGIGQAAGFESDTALLAAARAEREAMPEADRQLADLFDEYLERAFLGLD